MFTKISGITKNRLVCTDKILHKLFEVMSEILMYRKIFVHIKINVSISTKALENVTYPSKFCIEKE